jgi:hypothetical protein
MGIGLKINPDRKPMFLMSLILQRPPIHTAGLVSYRCPGPRHLALKRHQRRMPIRILA